MTQIRAAPMRRTRLLLYALVAGVVGLLVHVIGVAATIVGAILPGALQPPGMVLALVPGSVLIFLAAILAILDLFLLLPLKRRQSSVRLDPLSNHHLTVVLTAYNDAESIGLAVEDFLSHRLVRRVIVVDNNSRDSTAEVAERAGAIVVRETVQGYGACVFRALSEGLRYEDTELILLCEGDRTFRAFDIDKFLSYIAHADIVNGTRIVEQLRNPRTQLTTFMYYGNFYVGKLLEAKHLGAGTFTDIGTTYKLCRTPAVRALLQHLNREVNLEFNAHLLDTALEIRLGIVECPITFYPRVGESKGGNTDNWRAFQVGFRMIRGILLGWPQPRTRA